MINNVKSLNQRKEEALALRQEGFNCAQSVLMVFDDIIGMDKDTLCRLASGLGTGVGGSGELCGVPNAMAIAQGYQFPPEAKAKVASMKRARALMEEFKNYSGGKLRCADIKGSDQPIPCNNLILKGIEILHNLYLSQENPS